MSLRVWLPLNGNLNNQGLSNLNVINNGATTDDKGKIGKCYKFNNSPLSMQINTGNIFKKEFSFSCWCFFTNNTSAQYIFQLGGGHLSATWQPRFAFGNDNGKLFIYINGTEISTEKPSRLNQWVHYCFTYDGNKIKLYENGINIYNYNFVAPNFSPSNNLVIGGRANNASATSYAYNITSNGKLNDFRIYDHCLSKKEIKEISKGLCLHYQLKDKYIESTTNIMNSISNAFNGVTTLYGFGESTNIYKTYGVYNGKSCCKIYTNNQGEEIFPYISTTPSYCGGAGGYRSISFDYYPTVGDYIVFYSYSSVDDCTYSWINGNYNGSSSSAIREIRIPVNINEWNHIELSLFNMGTGNGSTWQWIKLGNAKHISNNSNYWLLANIQIENKEHCTPYVEKSRNDDYIPDCSGFGNNGICAGTIEYENDSARYDCSYKFTNSAAQYIYRDALEFLDKNQGITFSCWAKQTNKYTTSGDNTSHNMQFIVSQGRDYYSDSNEKSYGANISVISGEIYARIAKLNLSSGVIFDQSSWYHIVVTCDSTMAKIYVNGHLKNYNDISNDEILWTNNTGRKFVVGKMSHGYSGTTIYFPFVGNISDVRVYSTALSAEDVLQLYEVGASIDNNKNMYGYEFVEG